MLREISYVLASFQWEAPYISSEVIKQVWTNWAMENRHEVRQMAYWSKKPAPKKSWNTHILPKHLIFCKQCLLVKVFLTWHFKQLHFSPAWLKSSQGRCHSVFTLNNACGSLHKITVGNLLFISLAALGVWRPLAAAGRGILIGRNQDHSVRASALSGKKACWERWS